LTEATEISVIVVDTNGCTGQAQLMLRVESDVDIYVPNVFTPNGDGMNDKFTLYSNNDVEIVTLEIFDRWGNCVFINNEFPSNDPEYGWDGIYSNQPMNPDVFAFRAVVREPSGEQYAYKGDVTLVR
jgi:gliding motility-associated-like protein